MLYTPTQEPNLSYIKKREILEKACNLDAKKNLITITPNINHPA